jgi:hypothetical protein
MNPAALLASAAGSIVIKYSRGRVTVLPKLQPSSIRRGRAGGMPDEGGRRAGAACSSSSRRNMSTSLHIDAAGQGGLKFEAERLGDTLE